MPEKTAKKVWSTKERLIAQAERKTKNREAKLEKITANYKEDKMVIDKQLEELRALLAFYKSGKSGL